MMRIFVVLAATALAGSALADDKGASGATATGTPGHQMQKDRAGGKDVDKGASSYAPGQKMQDDKAAGKDVDRGASSYTPSRQNSGSAGGSTGR